MKKITLSVLSVLTGLALQATSSLEIRDQVTGAVLNGATFNYWVAANSSTHSAGFDAFNTGNSAISYKISKQNVAIDAGASSWFCVFHNGDATDIQSHCYLPAVTTTAHSFATDAGEFNTLQADFSAGPNNAISTVRFTVFDMNNTADSASITLVYHVSPLGVASVFGYDFTVSEAFPNPSSGISNFSFEKADAPVSFGIYNINGELIRSGQFNTLSGTVSIDLSDLSNGVYFCRFASAEMVLAERRILIAK